MYAKAANTVRGLVMDMVQKANSGHPGGAMGLADVATVLWLRYLKVDATAQTWSDRDRFVLSGGHLSALQYSLAHLAGFPISLEDLHAFRQWGSKTPGHPEFGIAPSVDITTGPLGQGLAAAVGMACAERMLAERFNVEGETPVVDHRTWVFCGDGDLEEGVSHEAASLAGHLALEKLVVFYDCNRITIEGGTGLSMSDDHRMRFKAYGWHVLETDGHDIDSIDKTIRKALKLTGRPVMIICNTHIAYGSPNKCDSASSHGAPLGAEEVLLAKKNLGLPEAEFNVPDEIRALFTERFSKCKRVHNKWKRNFAEWSKAHPEKAQLWDCMANDRLPEDIGGMMPGFPVEKAIATRSASGQIMNALAAGIPQLVGGSADLGPSNNTILKAYDFIEAGKFGGRNFHFGIRELAMSCFVNGLAAHGFFRPYAATFLVFSDYCRPAMRLASLMRLPVIYIFTHDSFHVGEDGATHEPIEHLAALRCMPGLTVLRPADANETAAAWQIALRNQKGPTVMLLSRQNLPVIDRASVTSCENVEKGAYILWQTRDIMSTPDLIMMASGSEVEIALAAAKRMTDKNVRVVSMPSWELFEKQNRAYRERIIDVNCQRRMAIEAGTSFGWHKYLSGCRASTLITIDHFGASAPSNRLAAEYGFTPENVESRARELFRI